MGFLYIEVVRVLLDPGETRVSKKGIDPPSLRFSVVNCIYGSMEFMYWRDCWLCSACWMTKVSSTHISHSQDGLRTVLMALGFEIFCEHIGY